MSQENVNAWRQRTKKKAAESMGRKCSCCGLIDDYDGVYDFHHLDPSTKIANIANLIAYGNSWHKICLELRKCIIVCANCHRKIEGKLLDVGHLTTSFNENFDAIVNSEEIDSPSFCPDCGANITRGATRCRSCAAKESNNRKVAKENLPSRDELKDMIRTLSFSEIGRRYNISDNAIRKWCKNMSLPTRKSDIKNYSDEEWLLI